MCRIEKIRSSHILGQRRKQERQCKERNDKKALKSKIKNIVIKSICAYGVCGVRCVCAHLCALEFCHSLLFLSYVCGWKSYLQANL